MTFDAFDVVVTPFPFADIAVQRKRPALVLSPWQGFGSATGVAPQPVFVTEARALFFTELTVNTRDSEYRNLSATTSLTVTPHRLVRIHYAGTGWYLSQRLGLETPAETRDLNHQVSAHYDPSPRAGFDARVQLREATTGIYTEDTIAYSLGTRLTPIRKLQLSFLCETREDDFAEGVVEGRLCSGNASAQIFPALDLTFGASDRQEEHVEAGGTLSTRSYHVAASARLTQSLRLNLNGTSTRTESTGDFPTILPPSRDERINADFDLRVGRALGLGVAVGWVAGEERSGVTQRYRVRWNPFGDGAITLTTSYNQDIDPYSNSRSRRLFVSPRWQINNVTALTIGYSSVALEGQQSFQSESILASLSFFR